MKYRYVGDGNFLQGIPARDLTEADWARLSKAQQAAVKKSGLYEEVKAEKAKEA